MKLMSSVNSSEGKNIIAWIFVNISKSALKQIIIHSNMKNTQAI